MPGRAPGISGESQGLKAGQQLSECLVRHLNGDWPMREASGIGSVGRLFDEAADAVGEFLQKQRLALKCRDSQCPGGERRFVIGEPCQHEDRCSDTGGAQARQDGQAGHIGKMEVQYHSIVHTRARHGDALSTGRGAMHLETLQCQEAYLRYIWYDLIVYPQNASVSVALAQVTRTVPGAM